MKLLGMIFVWNSNRNEVLYSGWDRSNKTPVAIPLTRVGLEGHAGRVVRMKLPKMPQPYPTRGMDYQR